MRLSLHLAVLILFGCPASAWGQEAQLVHVQKIWDAAPHNAFTDLVRFHDRWFCVFREGQGHVSPDGALRVITSQDGRQWESAALIRCDDADLRDAKITIMPGGQLMLCGAAAWHDQTEHSHQSMAWFSKDGFDWSEGVPIGDPDVWLWRVTWHGETAYGMGYATRDTARGLRLYRSADGRQFETLVANLLDTGYPNETSMVFDGDTAYCLLRRDGDPDSGRIGTARPPYTHWHWRNLGMRIGGPHMLQLDDGRLVAAVRLYDGQVRTALCWVDPAAGRLMEFLALPSGGDTSYAGLLQHEGQLWVSYYSSHEGKTSIYLAQVLLPEPVIDIGSRRELFVDDHLIARSRGLRQEMMRPQPREVALVCDAPWEGNISAYYTIFADEDRFRMYYRGAHFDEQARRAAHAEFTCYAESQDGIHWTKPNLGLYEFQGSKENNIVWAEENTHNFTVLKDSRPDCPAQERYKALAGSAVGSGGQGLIAYQSPDGIHWSRMQSEGVIVDGDFDSQNLAFWHPRHERYLAYHRKFRDGIRDIMVSWSTDFLHWSPPEYLDYGNAPEEQLYTNAIQPYLHAPHLLVGFPTRFDPASQQVEPLLMTSRDGWRFRRWPQPLIPHDAPQDRGGNRSNYMAWGLLALPGHDRELSVYATEAYYTGPGSRVRRFTFRTDGFVALRAGPTEGELITRPLRFEGQVLRLNYAAAPGGELRVALEDAAGEPIAGFQWDDCQPLREDSVQAEVSWTSGASLEALAGQAIRVHLVLRQADIYALQFGNTGP